MDWMDIQYDSLKLLFAQAFSHVCWEHVRGIDISRRKKHRRGSAARHATPSDRFNREGSFERHLDEGFGGDKRPQTDVRVSCRQESAQLLFRNWAALGFHISSTKVQAS
jgi:hypothetical protein